MHKVEWCDGLNTGVKEIDNDHKQILFLINQISDAIENHQFEESIASIFDQLEDYTTCHFSREEALLRRHRFKDIEAHAKSHQSFSNKIDELRKIWQANKSQQVAEDISRFLVNWLIHHIVEEDLPFISTLSDTGTFGNRPASSTSLINRAAKWLSKHILLRKRILLIAILPLTVVMSLGSMITLNNIGQLNKISRLEDLVQLADYTGEVIHNLQIERGLSIGVLSTRYKNFSQPLIEQQALSDEAIVTLDNRVSGLSLNSLSKELNSELEGIKRYLRQLPVLRTKIQDRTTSSDQVKSNYTNIISNLLSITNGIAHSSMNSELSNRMISFNTIMHLKEAVGLERALGVKAIENHSLTGESLQNFTLAVGKQQGLLQAFEQVASPFALKAWQQMNAGDISTSVSNLERKFLIAAENKQIGSMNSTIWFALLSDKMNELNILSDRLVVDLQAHAAAKRARLNTELILTSTLVLALLALSLLFSKILTRSITHPIRKLTRAMTQLSTGNRNIRLKNELAYDELRQMGAAYELCRFGLLQGDLEDIELKNKDRESEFYKGLASKDPLTGAFNRREFFLRANTELDRSNRYNCPLTVIMVDLDHFKTVNDTFGHANGDLILQMFANSCASQLRLCDIFARIGGEEFAILLPETTLPDALALAERVRTEVNKIELAVDKEIVRVTASIGVAQWNSDKVEPFNVLLERADSYLYIAKSSGRDKIIHGDIA